MLTDRKTGSRAKTTVSEPSEPRSVEVLNAKTPAPKSRIVTPRKVPSYGAAFRIDIDFGQDYLRSLIYNGRLSISQRALISILACDRFSLMRLHGELFQQISCSPLLPSLPTILLSPLQHLNLTLLTLPIPHATSIYVILRHIAVRFVYGTQAKPIRSSQRS